MKELIAAWGLSLIQSFAPAERLAAAPQFPGWEETAEQKTARYTDIANDLATVVYDSEFKPFFPGKEGRARSYAMMLAIAYHEGGFAHDVDKGPCYQGKNGGKNNKVLRCDGGRAACLMQVHVTWKGKTKEGFTKEDLFKDRKKCFTAAATKIRQSLATCSTSIPKHRLAAYGSGRCSVGLSGSRRLWSMYEKFWSRSAAPQEEVVVAGS